MYDDYNELIEIENIGSEGHKMIVCALCGKQAKLMQSHIIPKLVYRRIKSHPNSRFRSMDDFKREIQDGEKRPMLCTECEKKFSAYETWFANNFLDQYLNTDIIPSVDEKRLNDYILSVAWRILWDDLYRLESFKGECYQPEIANFEEQAKLYFLNGGNTGFFVNKVYRLEDLVQCPESLANGSLFGYTVFNPITGPFVIAYYAGLVYVTQYIEKRRVVISLDTAIPTLDEVVVDELLYIFHELQQQLMTNMTPELLEKIKKRYQIP